jgi:hypothetical protein
MVPCTGIIVRTPDDLLGIYLPTAQLPAEPDAFTSPTTARMPIARRRRTYF